MSQDEAPPTRAKRERSTRYPGVPLAQSVEFCRFIEREGLDGLTATDIASASGIKNIKTNTFSAKLSAARQFGLLLLKDEGYGLTPLARSILHPIDPDDVPRLYRQALLEPPLYADLAEQFADKRVPDAPILGNVLYHNYQIIASAKQVAAQAFLDSARFAGSLGEDHVFHAQGRSPAPAPAQQTPTPTSPTEPLASASQGPPSPRPGLAPARANDVRIDLRLWGADAGKSIRLRAPEAITPASFDRLLQTLRLHLRIEEPEAESAEVEEVEVEAEAD